MYIIYLIETINFGFLQFTVISYLFLGTIFFLIVLYQQLINYPYNIPETNTNRPEEYYEKHVYVFVLVMCIITGLSRIAGSFLVLYFRKASMKISDKCINYVKLVLVRNCKQERLLLNHRGNNPFDQGKSSSTVSLKSIEERFKEVGSIQFRVISI